MEKKILLIAIVALYCAIVPKKNDLLLAPRPPMGLTQANEELATVSNHQPRRADREVQATARNGRARPKPYRARPDKPKGREIMK
ncbi:unnamed protein product [Caenorhabditis nigoni]